MTFHSGRRSRLWIITSAVLALSLAPAELGLARSGNAAVRDDGSDASQLVLTTVAPCPSGIVPALINGKRSCLHAGQPCLQRFEPVYRRYGLTCARGHLQRKASTSVTPPTRPIIVTVSGAPETVFRWSTDRCEDLDIPDLPARAFRDAQGRVQLIAAHYVNRRFIGPDFNHLVHDCAVILSSDFNPDPAAFDDHEWISSLWTADGSTIYALIHDEYQGNNHPGQCPSGLYEKCWWNTITLATSTDGGATYADASQPRLVASFPFRYVPDSGTFGAMTPTNIVQNPRDGYHYAIIYIKQQPVGGPNNNHDCLIRTQTPADPSSWRAWSGGNHFDTTFIDPYRSTADPAAHTCEGVSPDLLGDFVPGSLTFSSYANQWILVGVSGGGFYYSLSKDLIYWSRPILFYPAPVPWTYTCGGPDPVHYPSLIDPSSTSRNFDTVGKSAYLYFTQFHTSGCVQGLNRDLVRIPVTLK
jgi:hypothetical protein